MQTGKNITVRISGISHEVVTLSFVVQKRNRGVLLWWWRGLWFHLSFECQKLNRTLTDGIQHRKI